MKGYLTDFVKVLKLSDPTTAGTSGVDSGSVDMAQGGGFDGVLFITSYGVANANNILKAAQSDDDGVADDFTDLAGTAVASGASDEDVWIDVLLPTKRYVRVSAARGTSSALGDIWALLYRGRTLPTVQNLTGTITGEQHASESEGTA